MTDSIYPVQGPILTATSEFDGNFLEFGAGSASATTGMLTIQFTPDIDWDGQFVVMARTAGQHAKVARVPFLPVTYRRLNVNGAVADRGYTADPITSAGMIEVPANGQSIALLMSCADGTCQVAISRVSGTLNV